MDVVAKARTVWRRVIGSEELKLGLRLQRLEGREVSGAFRIMIFPELSILICPAALK